MLKKNVFRIYYEHVYKLTTYWNIYMKVLIEDTYIDKHNDNYYNY